MADMNETTIEEDQRISAWHKVAEHPFFRGCFDDEGHTLIESMLCLLDSMCDQEPVEDRLRRAYVNGFRDGMERSARGRLDHS